MWALQCSKDGRIGEQGGKWPTMGQSDCKVEGPHQGCRILANWAAFLHKSRIPYGGLNCISTYHS